MSCQTSRGRGDSSCCRGNRPAPERAPAGHKESLGHARRREILSALQDISRPGGRPRPGVSISGRRTRLYGARRLEPHLATHHRYTALDQLCRRGRPPDRHAAHRQRGQQDSAHLLDRAPDVGPAPRITLSTHSLHLGRPSNRRSRRRRHSPHQFRSSSNHSGDHRSGTFPAVAPFSFAHSVNLAVQPRQRSRSSRSLRGCSISSVELAIDAPPQALNVDITRRSRMRWNASSIGRLSMAPHPAFTPGRLGDSLRGQAPVAPPPRPGPLCARLYCTRVMRHSSRNTFANADAESYPAIRATCATK